MRRQIKSQETITLLGQTIAYTYIRSDRRSLSLSVTESGLIVKAPLFLSKKEVLQFMHQKQSWILQRLKDYEKLMQQKESNPALNKYSDTQKAALEKRYRELARTYLTKRCEYYVSFTGGHYDSITIRSQKTRWGSCSSNGTLSFNWRLILAPPVVLDYVVVHELCHLRYMNHSQDFWNHVASVMPDYKIRKKWLRIHGQELAMSYEPIPFENMN